MWETSVRFFREKGLTDLVEIIRKVPEIIGKEDKKLSIANYQLLKN